MLSIDDRVKIEGFRLASRSMSTKHGFVDHSPRALILMGDGVNGCDLDPQNILRLNRKPQKLQPAKPAPLSSWDHFFKPAGSLSFWNSLILAYFESLRASLTFSVTSFTGRRFLDLMQTWPQRLTS